MATEILPVGITAASSSDVPVSAGSTVVVSLKSGFGGMAPTGSRVYIEIKDSASNYNFLGVLTEKDSARVVDGGTAGLTFRVRREAGVAVGVEQG